MNAETRFAGYDVADIEKGYFVFRTANSIESRNIPIDVRQLWELHKISQHLAMLANPSLRVIPNLRREVI